MGTLAIGILLQKWVGDSPYIDCCNIPAQYKHAEWTYSETVIAAVSFAACFNKITSVMNFRLFSGIVLLTAQDTCMVPAGFTLTEHSCHSTVPWAVLCQPQHMFSYMPTAVHNLSAHNIV